MPVPCHFLYTCTHAIALAFSWVPSREACETSQTKHVHLPHVTFPQRRADSLTRTCVRPFGFDVYTLAPTLVAAACRSSRDCFPVHCFPFKREGIIERTALKVCYNLCALQRELEANPPRKDTRLCCVRTPLQAVEALTCKRVCERC